MKNGLINEELTRADVRSIVNSEIDDYIKSNKHEKNINNIVAKVLENFLDSLWRKKSFWKDSIKKY